MSKKKTYSAKPYIWWVSNYYLKLYSLMWLWCGGVVKVNAEVFYMMMVVVYTGFIILILCVRYIKLALYQERQKKINWFVCGFRCVGCVVFHVFSECFLCFIHHRIYLYNDVCKCTICVLIAYTYFTQYQNGNRLWLTSFFEKILV